MRKTINGTKRGKRPCLLQRLIRWFLIKIHLKSPEDESLSLCEQFKFRYSSESTESMEQWFVRKLSEKAQKSGKGCKRIGTKETIVLSRNCIDDSDTSADVYDCFVVLAKDYRRRRRMREALRVLRFAAVYSPLKQNDRRMAVEMALQENVATGFWIGEAALDYISSGGEDSRGVLSNAAAVNNELSAFILNC